MTLTPLFQTIKKFIGELGAPIALAVLALGVLGFIQLADEVAEGDTHGFDRAVLLAIRGTDRPEWLQHVVGDLTALGGYAVLTLWVLAAAIYLIAVGKKGAALLVFCAVGGGALLSESLKLGFARARPDVVEQLDSCIERQLPERPCHAVRHYLSYARHVVGADARAKAHQGADHRFWRGADFDHRPQPNLSRRALADRCHRRMGAGRCLGLALVARCAAPAARPFGRERRRARVMAFLATRISQRQVIQAGMGPGRRKSFEAAAQSDRLSAFARSLPRLGSALSYISAAGVVVASALLKPLLDHWAGASLPPYITFYPAVALAALLGGPRAGLAAAWVTLMVAWFFYIEPIHSFALVNIAYAMTVLLYLLSASAMGVVVGLSRVAFDRVAAEEAARDRAARESVHRIKNLISVVQAIAAKVATETSAVDRFQSLLRSRLAAIGHAQDVLIKRDWQDADLEDMIKSALEPFLYNPGLTVKPGPQVIVPADYVSGMCMALYELCTNSMKYGALVGGKGPVTLTWTLDEGQVALSWNETLAEPVMRETTGFGSALIRSALSGATDTSVRYEIEPRRVEAEFRWPASEPE